MICPNTGKIPTFATRWLARAVCLMGNGKKRVMGFGPFNEEESFDESCDSSFARFEYYRQKRLYYRHLRNCAPTYGWLLQALSVKRTLLNMDICATVQAPVLLFQSEQDALVLPKPQQTFIERIPHGELICVKGTKHEIYMAENHVLQPFLDTILSFFAK